MKKDKNSLSLKTVLMIIAMIIILIPMLVISVITNYISIKNNRENFYSTSAALCEVGKGYIDDEISGYGNVLKSIVENVDFDKLQSDEDKAQLRSTMMYFKKSDDVILNIYYADSTGAIVDISNTGLEEEYNAVGSEWFDELMADPQKTRIEEPYEDSVTGEITTTVYETVKSKTTGKAIGVLGLDINLASLSEKISSIKYGKTGELIITDVNGAVVANTSKDLIGSTEPGEYSSWNEIVSKESGNTSFKYDGKDYIVDYSTSEITSWKILMRIENSELESTKRQMILFSFVVGLITAVGAILFSYVYGNKISKPVNLVKDSLERCANGEFNFTIPENEKTMEFVKLERSFNEMQHKVAELINHVDTSVLNVNTSANDSVKISREIAVSMQRVNDTVTQISKGTMESSSNLEKITINMEDLSKNMDDIQAITDNLTVMTKDTNKLSQSGINIANEVMDKSNETKESTKEVENVVYKVSESISSIEAMNQAISNITGQTNLLALNAAIEAARAGEAGRGFAVVADEIRKLAEETSISAKQIDTIIKEIKENVEVAVERVNKTTTTVAKQEEAVQESQDIFKTIVSSVEDLGKRIDEISKKISEVNAMEDDVTNQVSNLSAILEETAAGSEQVADSSEEVTQATTNSVADFEKLKEVAEELKMTISAFKF